MGRRGRLARRSGALFPPEHGPAHLPPRPPRLPGLLAAEDPAAHLPGGAVVPGDRAGHLLPPLERAAGVHQLPHLHYRPHRAARARHREHLRRPGHRAAVVDRGAAGAGGDHPRPGGGTPYRGAGGGAGRLHPAVHRHPRGGADHLRAVQRLRLPPHAGALSGRRAAPRRADPPAGRAGRRAGADRRRAEPGRSAGAAAGRERRTHPLRLRQPAREPDDGLRGGSRPAEPRAAPAGDPGGSLRRPRRGAGRQGGRAAWTPFCGRRGRGISPAPGGRPPGWRGTPRWPA